MKQVKKNLQALSKSLDQLTRKAEKLAKKLEIAVNGLPPRCQLIYRMIREDGLKYKEVAEILDISLKAIENQMLIAIYNLERQ